jgi:DNA invertase Pin-like site-specific DNA recombinase
MFASLAQLERDVITERTTGGRNERGKIDGEKGGHGQWVTLAPLIEELDHDRTDP